MTFCFRVASTARRTLGIRQYARILEGWAEELGLDPADYGTHSMRRTKATLSRRTKNLRAVQLLLGHSKLNYVPCRTMSSTLDPAQGDGGGMPDIVGPSLRALEERRLACSLAVGAKACRQRSLAGTFQGGPLTGRMSSVEDCYVQI